MTSIGHRLRLLAFTLTLSHPLFAVSSKVVQPKLDKLGVNVNGESRQITQAETLNLIKGDDLVLVYASLDGSLAGPSVVNFIGYKNLVKGKVIADDRSILIKTQTLPEREKDKHGVSNYRVEAKSGKNLHGQIRVSVLPPELKQLDLLINGTRRAVRNQETLALKAHDSFHVQGFQTNDPRIDKEARIAMEPLGGAEDGVEIKIFYRTHAFASIRLLLRQP